jgi:hypothetical protein
MYGLLVSVECEEDGDVTAELSMNSIDATDDCSPTIYTSHKLGCPVFSANTWYAFALGDGMSVTITLIVSFFGIFLLTNGRKFFPFVVAILGFLFGFATCYLLFNLVFILDTDGVTTNTAYFFAIVVSILVGVFHGFIINKMLDLAGAIIGGVAGYLLGLMLSTMIFASVEWEGVVYIH